MDISYLINIEKAVLSSIFFNYEELHNISQILKTDDFYNKGHQIIYNAILHLHDNDLPIDEDFVKKEIQKYKIDDVFLIDILSANPITNTEAYCLEIKENSRLRKLNDISKKIQFYSSNGEENSDDILHFINQEIQNIENDTLLPQISTNNLINELLNDMENASQLGNKILGQKSGLEALDNIIGAFEDGDLIIVAARPSIGKTSFISSITIQSLLDNNGVLIESLEMPSKKILSRLISAKSGENLTDLKKGLIKNKVQFDESINFFRNDNLIIHDKSYPTLTELQSRIKSTLRKNPNIRNILVDHTGKIQLLGKTREDIEIGQISAMLKKIARDYNIRVFLLQQLNRSVESRDDKRPLLSDIKNSGNIEEDADIVLGLYRDSYYKKKKTSMFSNNIEDAEIIILKNRDGETSTAKVSFEGSSARFLNKVVSEPITVEFE